MAIPINEDPHCYKYDDSEEIEVTPCITCRPPSIEDLCARTKFCRKELQILYRAFKQGCPNGTVMLPQFKEVYAQFFPQGNSNGYAELVFSTFDRDLDGYISFEEFVLGLSVISRGTVLEKLDWIFSLYDVSHKGSVGYVELVKVVRSMYDLLGTNALPPVSSSHIRQHVADLFKKMDRNKDGEISRREFIEMCQQDNRLCDSLTLFDTRL